MFLYKTRSQSLSKLNQVLSVPKHNQKMFNEAVVTTSLYCYARTDHFLPNEFTVSRQGWQKSEFSSVSVRGSSCLIVTPLKTQLVLVFMHGKPVKKHECPGSMSWLRVLFAQFEK